MATNRKLGRTTDARLAMLKTLSTDLILREKIETTISKAKEVQPIVESLIALAVKEKDNFEEVDMKISKAKLDAKGNKETELVKSKNGKEYLRVVKETTTEKRQKDICPRCGSRAIQYEKLPDISTTASYFKGVYVTTHEEGKMQARCEECGKKWKF